MKINTMRKIDLWIGVPLCFLLGVFCRIQRLFLKKNISQPPQKFLLIKLSEMGAIIVAYPFLKAIQKQYPNAEFHFLTFEKSRDVFKLLNGLIPENQLITIREQSPWAFVGDTFRALKSIRRERYDVTIDLEFFSRFTAILTFLSKAKKTIGFYRYHLEGLYRGNLLTHKVAYNPLIHMSQTYLSLVQVIGDDEKQTPTLKKVSDRKIFEPPQIPSTGEGRKKILQRLVCDGFKPGNRLFLFNPGEGMLPLREWPIKNFITLIKTILQDSNHFVALVGMTNATNKDQEIFKSVDNPRCVNLTDQTSVDELIELFHLADALIINDCGLAHIASLTPVKKFILWGPESPQIFAPLGEGTWNITSGAYCSPCLSVFNHRNSSCTDNQCLKAISPDHVYDLLKENCLRRGAFPSMAH